MMDFAELVKVIEPDLRVVIAVNGRLVYCGVLSDFVETGIAKSFKYSVEKIVGAKTFERIEETRMMGELAIYLKLEHRL